VGERKSLWTPGTTCPHVRAATILKLHDYLSKPWEPRTFMKRDRVRDKAEWGERTLSGPPGLLVSLCAHVDDITTNLSKPWELRAGLGHSQELPRTQ
jgi:hypothetical protein